MKIVVKNSSEWAYSISNGSPVTVSVSVNLILYSTKYNLRQELTTPREDKCQDYTDLVSQ